MSASNEMCPKCGSALAPVTVTPNGKKLQRCSKGSWNAETRKSEGCDFVKWLTPDPTPLDEKCPKCDSPLVLVVTRFGKKMKKCSTGGWDKETKKATGCDYIEWINGTTEPLAEECPECGEKLVLYTTANGKRMKKCSTAGWDKETRKPTGCTYVKWLTSGEYSSEGEEYLPPKEYTG